MPMIARRFPNDFDIVSIAVAAAYKALWIPPKPLPHDIDLMKERGVPELAAIALEAAERRHVAESGELPVAAWTPIITSLRLAGAYDQISDAYRWADVALNRFPTERLASFDIHVIRRELYSPASKWRGHFSATSASIAWLREFHFLCRVEWRTADDLESRASGLREHRSATIIEHAEPIARDLVRVEALAANWLEQMPDAFDVLMSTLAVESEIAESSPRNEQFTRVFSDAIQDDEFRVTWARFARVREMQEHHRPPDSDQPSDETVAVDDDEQPTSTVLEENARQDAPSGNSSKVASRAGDGGADPAASESETAESATGEAGEVATSPPPGGKIKAKRSRRGRKPKIDDKTFANWLKIRKAYDDAKSVPGFDLTAFRKAKGLASEKLAQILDNTSPSKLKRRRKSQKNSAD